MSHLRMISVAVALLATSTAMAAQVTGVSGNVTENSGPGFKRVANGQSLAPGTKILVQRGGSAGLVFPDGCRIQVPAEEIYIVPEGRACAKSALLPAVVQQEVVQTGVDPLLFAAVGVAVGGAAIAILASQSGHRRAHLSP